MLFTQPILLITAGDKLHISEAKLAIADVRAGSAWI